MSNNTIHLLCQFVNQRPGLEFCNYGSVKSYRSESRAITNDLHDFNDLLSLATSRILDLNERLTAYLTNNSGRLTLVDGALKYTTGQYFTTEYRPAACRVLVALIWASYRDEKNSDGTEVYASGHEIRKAIRRRVTRRVARHYFN